jgi:hypothetical protein
MGRYNRKNSIPRSRKMRKDAEGRNIGGDDSAANSTINNPCTELALVQAPTFTLQERHAVYLYATGYKAKDCFEKAGIPYYRESFRDLFMKQESQDYLIELYTEQKNGHLISMNQMQVELINRLDGAKDGDAVNIIKLLAQLHGTLQDDGAAKVAININWGEDDSLAWRKNDTGPVIEADFIDKGDI